VAVSRDAESLHVRHWDVPRVREGYVSVREASGVAPTLASGLGATCFVNRAQVAPFPHERDLSLGDRRDIPRRAGTAIIRQASL